MRYVITLDTDTWLPPDVGRELVGLPGTSLEPSADRPPHGPGRGGPRDSAAAGEHHASRGPAQSLTPGLMSPDAGIDPYTLQTSDVYEDVFGQGSFIGKGIYDVEAFETVLAQRFPDNRVLSHDLIEGCFARSGLVNDVELFEGGPSRLLSDMSRQHRWIRGDWQIAAWVGSYGLAPQPRAESARTAWPAGRLPTTSVAVSSPSFCWPSWCWGGVWFPHWLTCGPCMALGLVFGPVLLTSVPGWIVKPQDKPWRLHLGDQAGSLARGCFREALALTILPYRSHCHLDAILRTLYRLHVSGRKLLQWTTARDVEDRSASGCREHYELMWASTVCGVTLAAVTGGELSGGPGGGGSAVGGLVGWSLAGLALLADGSPRPRSLAAEESREFRRWARHTWQFFETHVGPRTTGFRRTTSANSPNT